MIIYCLITPEPDVDKTLEVLRTYRGLCMKKSRLKKQSDPLKHVFVSPQILESNKDFEILNKSIEAVRHSIQLIASCRLSASTLLFSLSLLLQGIFKFFIVNALA